MSKREKKRNQPSKQKSKQKKPQKEGIGALLKDLVTNPFEYRRSTGSLGKILGGICLIIALCLLFYITGHM